MASVTIAGRTTKVPAVPAHPKMTMRAGSGNKLILPFGPLPTSHGGFGWSWEAVERSGRTPLLLRSARNSRTLGFQLVLAAATRQNSIEHLLAALEVMADSDDTLTIAYSRAEAGRWRMTSMDYEITARAQGSNKATRATVTLGFARAVDVPRPIGKPKAKPKPATKGKAGAKPKAKKVRVYTMRRGDTLSEVAQRFYHDADRWKDLARVNKITNVRRIPVGKRIKVP